MDTFCFWYCRTEIKPWLSTGTDAIAGAGLDLVTGLRIGLTKTTAQPLEVRNFSTPIL